MPITNASPYKPFETALAMTSLRVADDFETARHHIFRLCSVYHDYTVSGSQVRTSGRVYMRNKWATDLQRTQV